MASEVICLDTSVLIDFYRKKNKARSLLYELTGTYHQFAVSAVTAYEIYVGSSDEQQVYWERFFKTISVLPFDHATSKTAVKVFTQLKQDRRQLDIPDLFIGMALGR